jgi:hypothetical protein
MRESKGVRTYGIPSDSGLSTTINEGIAHCLVVSEGHDTRGRGMRDMHWR